jgi:hypothetical protein
VRQLAVFQSRPVSRLRYTQLGVLASPLTRTSPGGEPSLFSPGAKALGSAAGVPWLVAGGEGKENPTVSAFSAVELESRVGC